MEAKRFLTTDEFDMVPIQGSVSRWEVKKQDYDFEQATGDSRFFVEFILDSGSGLSTLGAELKASRENCNYLKEIFLKYVLPNLKRQRPMGG